MYLSWSFHIPPIYLGPPFRRSRPSLGGGPLTVAFYARRGHGRPRAPWPCPRTRVPGTPLPGDRAAHGGLQVPPLVFSACDSATRNAATAVANNGANAPRQVTSQMIVAVAWRASCSG